MLRERGNYHHFQTWQGMAWLSTLMLQESRYFPYYWRTISFVLMEEEIDHSLHLGIDYRKRTRRVIWPLSLTAQSIDIVGLLLSETSLTIKIFTLSFWAISLTRTTFRSIIWFKLNFLVGEKTLKYIKKKKKH